MPFTLKSSSLPCKRRFLSLYFLHSRSLETATAMANDKTDGGKEATGYWQSFPSAAARLRSGAPDLTVVKGALGSSYHYGNRAVGSVAGAAKSACSASYDYGGQAVGSVAGATKAAGKASYDYGLRAIGALKGASVPIDASRKAVGSLMSDPENRAAIGRALAGASASAALSEASGFIPGGRPLYRVAKAGTTDFVKRYREEKAAVAGGVERDGEVLVRKVEKVEAELKELNRVVMEQLRMRGPGSCTSFPPPAAASADDGLRSVTGSVIGGRQEPKDVIRELVVKGFMGGDFSDALLVPRV